MTCDEASNTTELGEFMETKKTIAYIFEDIGGWYVNDNEWVEENNMFDTRGTPYLNKAMSLRAASKRGYTGRLVVVDMLGT